MESAQVKEEHSWYQTTWHNRAGTLHLWHNVAMASLDQRTDQKRAPIKHLSRLYWILPGLDDDIEKDEEHPVYLKDNTWLVGNLKMKDQIVQS